MPFDAFRLARIRGIDVKVDLSWLLVVALVTWSLWGRFAIDGHGRGTALLMALGGAALLWASILAHELAHALEAQRRGVGVRGITLFVFGGATETMSEARRPVDELAITAVGPLTSLVAAGVLAAAAAAARGRGWPELAGVTGLLAWLNLALGVFNLLPGAPLDGGRILRAGVWQATGDRRRAVRVAATAGQALGWSLVALGAYQLLARVDGFADGLWLVLIGWFLLKAATMERDGAGRREDHQGPLPTGG